MRNGIALGKVHGVCTTRDKRYEDCCHIILDSNKELVQSSSPAALHYLVAKDALDLITCVMGCRIDYTYADIEGWTARGT